MPMHPHAQPNFRNLFWYPFKITLITALRTFPFIGKRFGKRLGAYHNTSHPEFLDDGSRACRFLCRDERHHPSGVCPRPRDL